jgi:hypothetical protein
LFLCLLLTLPGAAQSQATASIRGVVTDVNGQPLAVRVGVIDQESAVMREIQTDASGRFQVDGLQPDRRYRVVASKFGYQAVTLDNITPGGEQLAITLRAVIQRPRQAAPPPTEPTKAAEAEEVVELKSNLVLLTVSVRDARGNPVPDLKQTNFTVYEDGAPQPITYFGEEDTPLSVVLLMDVSSSMEGSPLKEAKRAALEFVAQSHPDNEIALAAFNHQVRITQPFTRDHAQVRGAIDQLTATGGTALYDAVIKAIDLMSAARYARHVIVLLSDGKDEDSGKKFGQLEQ